MVNGFSANSVPQTPTNDGTTRVKKKSLANMFLPQNNEDAVLVLRNRVATKIFEDFGEALFKEFIIIGNLYQPSPKLGLEPVSIVHYTRLGSTIKQPFQTN